MAEPPRLTDTVGDETKQGDERRATPTVLTIKTVLNHAQPIPGFVYEVMEFLVKDGHAGKGSVLGMDQSSEQAFPPAMESVVHIPGRPHGQRAPRSISRSGSSPPGVAPPIEL